MNRYEIKCDDCKTTIGTTDSIRESAAGGRCDECAPVAPELLAVTITPADFTAKGNAVAFTAAGETIVIRKRRIPNVTEWRVEVTRDGAASLIGNTLDRTFQSKADAASYASSISDFAKTEELAWWKS